MNPQQKKHCKSGCGQQHDNENGCNHDGCGRCCGDMGRELVITDAEYAFLLQLAQLPFLHVARFVVRSSDPSRKPAAFAPVHLSASDDSMDEVLETGETLRGLQEKGLITLDYDQPLKNFDYSQYEQFQNEQAPGSQVSLERGSLALTPTGQEVLDSLELLI
jgi:hypothetical protein